MVTVWLIAIRIICTLLRNLKEPKQPVRKTVRNSRSCLNEPLQGMAPKCLPTCLPACLVLDFENLNNSFVI